MSPTPTAYRTEAGDEQMVDADSRGIDFDHPDSPFGDALASLTTARGEG